MTKRDRTLLMVIAVVLVGAAAWMFAIKPQRGEVARLDTEIEQAQSERDAVVAQVASARAARRSAVSDAVAIAESGKAIPPDDATASLIYQLAGAAGRTRVTFGSITTSGAAGSEADTAAMGLPAGVKPITFSLTFEGSFLRLERFLRRIHRFTTIREDRVRSRGRLVRVESLKMAAGPEGFPSVQAALTVTAFMGTPQAETPVAAGTTPAASDGSTTSAAPATGTAAVVGGAGR